MFNNFSKDTINNYLLVVIQKRYPHKNLFGLFYVSHNCSSQYFCICLTIQKSRSLIRDKRKRNSKCETRDSKFKIRGLT